MNDTIAHSVVFNDLFDKPLQARFDQPDSSSDGGAILLKGCDQNFGLIDAISASLRDDRHQGKVSHSLHDLVQQRVFGIACGYEDCNDSARLATDPVQLLLMDRDPITGQLLASQPTLSCFENQVDGRSLVKGGALDSRLCHQASRQATQEACALHYHRYGSDRRSNLRGSATDILQFPLRQPLLFASCRISSI